MFMRYASLGDGVLSDLGGDGGEYLVRRHLGVLLLWLSQLLLIPFDLAAVDTNTVLFGGDALNDCLPQMGHMRQCDGVLWHNPEFTLGVGHKLVRTDEFWVEGHIPGRPLLPGVLMIEAAAQLASFLNTKSGRVKGFLGFTRCDEVSFRGQVVPGDNLYLLASLMEFNRRRFVSHCQGVVNGKLVFDGKITGMTL